MTIMTRLAHAALVTVAVFVTAPAMAAERERVEAFLEVTGFGVALDSLRLSAGSAPEMIGLDAEDFGSLWTNMVDDVFDTATMRDMATEILMETLDRADLQHGMDFYASDLGQRLVAAENTSHMLEEEGLKSESGEAIVEGLLRIGSPRLAELKRLNTAVGSEDAAIAAIQEVQVRFLLAASAAGVIDMRMDEADLRARMKEEEGALRRQIQTSSLIASAYTYQAFSDEDITAYADALEDPAMQRVYTLMNAVQFEVMANRYEALARRMSALRPSQEL